MKRKWTVKEITEWYNKLPWLRGCNFLPSNCINRLDMWQSFGKKEHLETSDKELQMCQDLGFNTVRLWINFDVYYKEPKKFMDTLEKYIELCDKHKQSVMLVLAYEEDLPYGDTFVPKKLGKQKLWHNHFNRDYELEEKLNQEHQFRHYMEYPEIKPIYLEMVRKVVKKYRNDSRVFCWNVMNEPGIILGDRAIPILDELYELVRSLNPTQPLCSDVWNGVTEDGHFSSNAEQHGVDLSDFLSYHSYSPYQLFLERLSFVKATYDRPIIVTEWLQRCNHNTVEEIYPLLYLENMGCYCWGFVAGGTCTTEPWNGFWHEVEKNPDVNFDFSKWQHDLFRINYHPYDPREIRVIKRINELADIRDKRNGKI